MLKKIVVLSLLFPFFLYSKTYKGCGEDENSARDDLAKNIYIQVESNFEKEESLKNDEVSKSLKLFSKQSTKLKLVGVKIKKLENMVCATITKNKLEDLFITENKKLNKFSINKLPKNNKDAYYRLKDVISDTNTLIVLATVLSKDKEIGKIYSRQQQLQKYLESIQLQSVKFNVSGDNLRIQIDGKKRTFKVNEIISTSIGEHQYIIKSKNYCPYSGSFKLSESQDLIIDNIDMYEYSFPKLIFTSDKKHVTLKVNGEFKTLGKEIELKKCNGQITYEARYTGGIDNKPLTGTVTLKPNLNFHKTLNFISIKEIKELRKLSQSFKKGERLEFLYGYSIVDDEFKSDLKKSFHSFIINKIKHKKHFRYGYGFLFGLDDLSNPNSRNFELYWLGAIQFATFGKNDIPFHIGSSIAFIPYLGVELGVGYHEYRDEKNSKIYKYPSTKVKNSDENRDWDFTRDSLVVKPLFGIDFIVSKSIAFKIFVEKNIFIDKGIFFGTGITVSFD